MKYFFIWFALVIFSTNSKADFRDSYRMTVDGQQLILNEKQFFEIFTAVNDICSIIKSQIGLMHKESTKYDTGIERTELSSSASYIFSSNKMRDYVAFEKKIGSKLTHDNPVEYLFATLSAYKRNWQTISLFGSLDSAIDMLTVEDQQTGMYSSFKYAINRTEYKCRIRSVSYDKTKN